ncbi:hypothetical protein [Psychromonas sp. GE-S-Ul-11]|uniref:hypothetical protein n=1 Tax=unclassified Psychromonas TaxID=2614957 RepID=UPI00390C83AE
MVYIYNKYVILYLFLGFYLPLSSVYAASLHITWADSSSNEDGFYVEKRGLNENDSAIISTLSANTTSYTDNDVLVDESYCYRVIAFNSAGSSYSDESCMEVAEADDNGYDSDNDITEVEETIEYVDDSYSVALSHEFISKPIEIDVTEHGLYSFYDESHYNSDNSDATVSSVVFDVTSGNSRSRATDYFAFSDDDTVLSSGYVSMAFNTGNSITFDMYSNGTSQIARIYLQAGAWSSSSASVKIIAGDQTETITLTKGYSWQYMAVDISFEGTVPVTITTDSDHGGYSSVMVAGIVFDEIETTTRAVEEVIQYAALVDIQTDNGTNIDVSDNTFFNHQLEVVNSTLSNATLSSLSYIGTTKSRTNRYTFTDQNDKTYKGYQSMSWNPDNGIALTLNSGEQQVNMASIYLTAGAWSHESASIELIINGESEIITLSSGFSWKNYKVDIEFEGELNLEIRPIDTFAGYSSLMFAGVTLDY